MSVNYKIIHFMKLLCKDTIKIVYEYIHRDLYRDVMIQLKWCTKDIDFASKNLQRYKIIKCRTCKDAWTIRHKMWGICRDQCESCTFS